MMDSEAPTLYLKVKAEDITDLSIGQEVKATIRGKIVELEGERRRTAQKWEVEEGDAKEGEEVVYPPSLRLELSEVSIEGENEFSALMDDEDY